MSEDNGHPPDPPAESQTVPRDDRRLYCPDHQMWEVRLKRGWENDYCYSANPGEDWFHLILAGELYVQRGDEKYCLNCALRQGILTTNRNYWQKGSTPSP